MDFSSRRYANPKMPKLLYAIHLMGGLIAGVAWVVLALRIFRRFFCSDGQGWGMLTQVNTPAVQDGLESLFGADSGKTMKTVGLRRGAFGNGIRNLTGRLEIRFVFALSMLFCVMAVAIYLTRPPVRLPAMEPVLYAPNAELLRHPSNRPAAGCDVDYETSSCPLWYRSTEN
jgi:hypothetical protein